MFKCYVVKTEIDPRRKLMHTTHISFSHRNVIWRSPLSYACLLNHVRFCFVWLSDCRSHACQFCQSQLREAVRQHNNRKIRDGQSTTNRIRPRCSQCNVSGETERQRKRDRDGQRCSKKIHEVLQKLAKPFPVLANFWKTLALQSFAIATFYRVHFVSRGVL